MSLLLPSGWIYADVSLKPRVCSVGAKASHAMEEVTSSLSSVNFQTELNLEILESSSPASFSDDKEHSEDVLRSIKPTSKEFKKTWGFRKTTIAKREIISDTDMESADSSRQLTPSLRRSGRQPKPTERVEEFLTSFRRNREKKSNNLENSSDRSCPATDAETASEESVESTSEVKLDTKARDLSAKAQVNNEDDDSSDSDGITLKELQNKLRSRRSNNSSGEPVNVQAVSPGYASTSESTVRTRSANRLALLQHLVQTTPIKQEPRSPERIQDHKLEKTLFSPKRPEAENYDPNALYCICRQPHNNRFMICCDRCEEWFHGDCVGISESRGRLLEKDGEDYICPNCTILQEHEESGTDNEHKETGTEAVPCASQVTSLGIVEHCALSQGIKGRIEKAAHPSGKKKLKIFHPVAVPESVVQPQDVSEMAQVSHEVTTCAEFSDSPDVARCIGPGCANNALPDSVYCSHDCILKHAAAAMKSLSSNKESKPKEKVKVKSEKPPPKTQTSSKPPVLQKSSAPENMDALMKKALVVIPRMEAEASIKAKMDSGSSKKSWESDHNYIAVQPEKTAAISSTLFYKCMYHIGILP